MQIHVYKPTNKTALKFLINLNLPQLIDHRSQHLALEHYPTLQGKDTLERSFWLKGKYPEEKIELFLARWGRLYSDNR